MIPFKYPQDRAEFDLLKSNYVSVYSNLAYMQTEWTRLRNAYSRLNVFPQNIEDIMKADYRALILIYRGYHRISKAERERMKTELDALFNYDDEYREVIKGFLMNYANGFEINTCHYCDMAYVNIYTIDPTSDGLYFMNTASDDELKRKLKTESNRTINAVRSNRPYNSIADFEHVGSLVHWADDKFDKTFKPNHNKVSNFDVEHILDKGSCPIVALSLMNFVPSCQVCNSRLKKARILGKDGIPEEKLSPTSPLYDFDNGVTIRILPKTGQIKINPTQHREDYNLIFDLSDNDYKYFVNLFKLEERYSYHKIEALRWVELKQKYTDVRITMMSNALNGNPDFSKDKIREDIFGSDFTNNEHRCFSKMKRDILK